MCRFLDMNIQYHSAGLCEENGGFLCPDRACIPLVYLCDKVIDCSDGLDEGALVGADVGDDMQLPSQTILTTSYNAA